MATSKLQVYARYAAASSRYPLVSLSFSLLGTCIVHACTCTHQVRRNQQSRQNFTRRYARTCVHALVLSVLSHGHTLGMLYPVFYRRGRSTARVHSRRWCYWNLVLEAFGCLGIVWNFADRSIINLLIRGTADQVNRRGLIFHRG